MFHNWRYLDDDGNIKNPEFTLNQSQFSGASVLVTGENFGCGSSREHAPWALMDFGIKAIIAPSFADIFFGNCFNNGLLPICLSEDICQSLMDAAAEGNLDITIDLPAQTVTANGNVYEFEVEPRRKALLVAGLDAIALTLQLDSQIDDYEQALAPWR